MMRANERSRLAPFFLLSEVCGHGRGPQERGWFSGPGNAAAVHALALPAGRHQAGSARPFDPHPGAAALGHRRAAGGRPDVASGRLAPGAPNLAGGAAGRRTVRPGIPVHRPGFAAYRGVAHGGVPLYLADLLGPGPAPAAAQRAAEPAAMAGYRAVLRGAGHGLRPGRRRGWGATAG